MSEMMLLWSRSAVGCTSNNCLFRLNYFSFSRSSFLLCGCWEIGHLLKWQICGFSVEIRTFWENKKQELIIFQLEFKLRKTLTIVTRAHNVHSNKHVHHEYLLCHQYLMAIHTKHMKNNSHETLDPLLSLLSLLMKYLIHIFHIVALKIFCK